MSKSNSGGFFQEDEDALERVFGTNEVPDRPKRAAPPPARPKPNAQGLQRRNTQGKWIPGQKEEKQRFQFPTGWLSYVGYALVLVGMLYGIFWVVTKVMSLYAL